MDAPKRQHQLQHYRDDEATYLDCNWIVSDINTLPWDVRYSWIRLITGPENRPRSVSIEDLDPTEFGSRPLLDTLRLLRSINAVEVHDGLITFPNLHPGTPPNEEGE